MKIDFPNGGKARMLVVEGPHSRPAAEQIADLASICPPGEWSAEPAKGGRLPR